MYECESWTIKKAEHRRIDALKLWCWRRLWRVPWTARRSNQLILKEINWVMFLPWSCLFILPGIISPPFSSNILGTCWLGIIPEWSSGVPYFLQFNSEFGKKECIIWATVSSQSCFCWLYRNSPSSAAKNIISLISLLAIWWCPCVESSLVLLEEGVCYDQCIFLAKLY